MPLSVDARANDRSTSNNCSRAASGTATGVAAQALSSKTVPAKPNLDRDMDPPFSSALELASAIAQAPDKLQARPGRVDGAHFDVGQAGCEPGLAYAALGQPACHAGGLLGPGDPDHAGVGEPRRKLREHP